MCWRLGQGVVGISFLYDSDQLAWNRNKVDARRLDDLRLVAVVATPQTLSALKKGVEGPAHKTCGKKKTPRAIHS